MLKNANKQELRARIARMHELTIDRGSGKIKNMAALTAKTLPIVDEVVKIILEQYGPVEKIFLFGSSARGEADEYSDLDLIIVKKTDKPFLKRILEVPLFPVRADVFVYTPEEFSDMQEYENPFIMSALESAKILYERNHNS
jgi:predicted nucleotidyltransferase